MTWVGLRSPGCAGSSGCGNEVGLARLVASVGPPSPEHPRRVPIIIPMTKIGSDPRIPADPATRRSAKQRSPCLAIPLDTSMNLPLRTSAHASMKQPSCQNFNRVNFKIPHKTELCEASRRQHHREMSTLVNSANERRHSVLRLLSNNLTKSR